MAQHMQQISSVRTPDRQVARATRPRRFKYLNIPFIVIAAALITYGLIVVYSAVANNTEYNFSRQLGGVAVGVVLMILLIRYDYHRLSNYMVFFIIITVVLIMMPRIPGIGISSNGALSWVGIGPLRFQPGEFAKIFVVLLAASTVARYGGRLNDIREYLKTLAILAIPFVCILTQPDLGTGLVYLFISGVALIVGGARPRYIVVTVAIIVIAVVGLFLIDPIADSIAGKDVLLKDYQRARLLVFMDNNYDPTGDGYNLQQAKIAIGSGGLFGHGFMNAAQSSLGYLPESSTDFVFCVLAEEFGFMGSALLLALYIALILVCFRIAHDAKDLFGTIIVMCAAGMWLFQILENIGMDCGLMPITGIPLPFVSYGSSFMVVNFVMLGLIGSVWAHNGR
ncbi:MAG: rod shape-determining protein RodA [Eggerthellaceae bacterium]|nr:rod shape-determining protein RodA [Eggerthellaceae bacterium]MCH4220329.1 rod shape-determining protein RodA [Eggerthellaceae bacterium]